MPLSHPAYPHSSGHHQVAINPVFTCEPVQIPRNQLPPAQLDPDIAYQVVHDQLMLDGNARLNLATFVTTWMEPQATRLMTQLRRGSPPSVAHGHDIDNFLSIG
jgi:glutamate decarboxylase